MKKRISLIIIILSVLTLTSCVKFNNQESVEYVPSTEYESQLSATISQIEEYGVLLSVDNRIVGSGIVIEREKQDIGYKYYAITAGQNFTSKLGKLKASFRRNTGKLLIQNYSYNPKTTVGILEFQSYQSIKPITEDKVETYNIKKGQTVISLGSPGYNYDTKFSNIGRISDINIKQDAQYSFIHNSKDNIGQIGGGVFDINGNLIGLNTVSYLSDTHLKLEEKTFANTEAISSNIIYNVIKNFDKELMKNNILPNEIFDYKEANETYESTIDYENVYIKENESIEKNIVKVTSIDSTGTGLLIDRKEEKGVYKYTVITKLFENTFFVDVSTKNNKYKTSKIKNYKDLYISIIEFETIDKLDAYDSESLKNKKEIEFKRGQDILSYGYNKISGDLASLNNGVISLTKYNTEEKTPLFMHDLHVNFGQGGAPIFNLNGELIGFNVMRVDRITTNTGDIAAEGLSFGVSVNDISKVLNEVETFEDKIAYESNYEDERKVIKIVEEIDETVVTVKGDGSHGSGIIFKKEKIENDKYLYYVLTNEHVISNPNEIKISFNDDRQDIKARDYVSYRSLDMGVVRFESKDNYNVKEIDLESKNDKILPIKGQKVIAIGTPLDLNKKGYVTTGYITDETDYYNDRIDLAIYQDTAINPGNSGGPLFNLNGDLIGLNVSKIPSFPTTAGEVVVQRVGHSLNINVLIETIKKVKKYDYTKIKHTPRLGIVVTDKINIQDQSLIAKGMGIVVVGLDEEKDAFGKLLINDLITHINDKPINSVEDMSIIIRSGKIGTKYKIRVVRKENNQEFIKEFIIELS